MIIFEEEKMTDKEIFAHVDHTALSPTLTWSELVEELNVAIEYGCACMAISGNYVKRAREYFDKAGSSVEISSCISFPRGDSTTAVKVFEIKNSIENGATEIDAVVNQCEVKNKNWGYIENEFIKMKEACGNVPLKIIIETSELNTEEKIKLCELITKAGIDYVKTSTGFSKSGATMEDILLIKKHIGGSVKIKASGGIRTREDAVAYLEAGVDRIGTKFTKDFVSK